MKISKKWLRMSNMICAVLMLALLVLQFLPYWVFPACTCTELCESKLNHSSECKLCRAYYKVCALTPASTGELKYNVIPTGDHRFFKIEHNLDEPLSWDRITVQYEAPASAGSTNVTTDTDVVETTAPVEVTEATVATTEDSTETTEATVATTEDSTEATEATVATTEDSAEVGEPTEAVEETVEETTEPISSGLDIALELSPDTLNLNSDNAFTGTSTVGSVTLSLTQIGVDGSGLQMYSENGTTSILCNTTALPGKITRIIFEYNSSNPIFNNKDAVVVSFGSAQDNLTETSTVSTQSSRVDYRYEWKLSIQQYSWTPTFESCDGATEYFTKFFTDCYDKETRATVLADDMVVESALDNYYTAYVNATDDAKLKDYEFKVKDIVLMPVIVFVCALLGLYFCTLKAHNPLVGIIPLLAGVSGIVGYLTVPVFQFNNNYTPYMWLIHLGVAALIAVVSLVPITECIFRAINWLNPKKAQ